MYEFTSSAQKAAFLDAIEGESLQHIKGVLHLATRDVQLDDTNTIEGSPHIEQKCTENDDTFMFGQMYVGTLEISLNVPSLTSAATFRDAQISLEFGIDIAGSDEPLYIPLGIWDVTSVKRLVGDSRWKVKGVDRLNRLRVNINDDTVGRLTLSTVISTIKRTTNVQFAQTVEEIAALIGKSANRIAKVEFSSTCWEEVRQIAQLMGGFAFANREGKIEFRQFGMQSVLDSSYKITASQRFNLKLSDYNYGVDTVTYIDSKKHSYTKETGTSGGSVGLSFSNNQYIFTGSDDYEEYFATWVDPIAAKFTQTWYSGTVDYYGNPAFDLGDMIPLTGGIAGQDILMLITGISWGFRAPQVITSAGLPDIGIGTASSSSGSSSYSSGTSSQVLTATEQQVVELDTFPGDLSGRYIAAQGVFGARQSIDGFVNVGIVLLADENGAASFTVELDGIAQVLSPTVSVHQGEYTTLYANVPISPKEGSHTVEVICRGSGTITEISALVVGQDISPESPDPTFDSDYTYTIANGVATVTGYNGSSTYPRIPDRLGGAPVKAIAGGAFTGTSVRNVYIPEGVEEIQ